MNCRTDRAKTSVALFPGSMHDGATECADDRCRTMHNFEKDHREAAKASLERSPDEIKKFTRLPTVAHNWTRTISGAILALLLVAFAYAQEEIVKATHATIQHVDSTAKTVLVKTDDGVGHTLHFLDSTAVHGGDAADVASKDSWHGLKEGGEVVVHYTKRGTENTAIEIDKIGDGGLNTTEGTVTEIDRGGKNLVVVAGDGTVNTFQLTGQAAKDAGTGIGKGSKVTVFYIGKAGKKVAHFLGTTSSGPY